MRTKPSDPDGQRGASATSAAASRRSRMAALERELAAEHDAAGKLAIYEEIRRHAAALEREVDDLGRAHAQLAYRSSHDPVTGLPRFALPADNLGRAMRRGEQAVVAYVDLDRFHLVNETRGRAIGDEVLREVAKRLLDEAAGGGAVAHLAADEFAVVLTGVTATRANDIAEQIRRSLQEPILLDGQRIYISCSIGVSGPPGNGSGVEELLRQAETAMQRAKDAGRNAVRLFEPEQKREHADRLAIGMRLSDAVRNGELVVHYQPLISARDWQLVGFEALVRWQHPDLGLLAPERFLPIAEDLGLIVDIDNQVLAGVCRQVHQWIERGERQFVVSVNVSARELERPDFVQRIRRVLDQHRVPAGCIELELTERVTTGNIEHVIAAMRAFKALGVKLSLDDFGTGYSSLNYLRRLPIDKLKIDRSFVGEISSDPGAAGICRAIVALGHQLGMKVLAEGVETAAQVGYLRRNDCDQFQGYYFARPVAAEAAFEFLRNRFVPHEGLDHGETPKTVLLVDDEDNVLNALTRTLRRDGYRILVAHSVDEALDVLARNDVQVIVSDQRMPGTSGTEFLGKVKDMYPRTMRMILSGYGDLGTVTDAVNRGAIYKFLTKPWNDDELRAHVHEAFRVAAADRPASAGG